MTPTIRTGLVLLLAALVAGPAVAQLPGGGGLPGGVGLPSTGDLPWTPDLDERLGGALDPARGGVDSLSELISQRRRLLDELVRRNPRELDVDDHGAAVVRDEILIIAPAARSLARVQAAGFVVARRVTLEGADLELVTLAPPRGLNARRAIKRLKKVDPDGVYEFNHIYSGAGDAAPARVFVPAATLLSMSPRAAGPSVRVGLIDTGVDAGHPALAGARIEQRGFSPGGVRPAAHGTAAASLLAATGGGVRGAAPGATVLAADVYGAGPTGGSAEAVARALGWLEASGVPVINISLVGPRNQIIQAMVRRLLDQGVLIVAAVGNDGPAAPPLYPAGWPGVIAVTGVDRRDRVLPEACRGAHMDFAAPGADMVAAGPGGGLRAVRGTSYAAPLVAGKLAVLRRGRGPAQAVAALGAQARDLGPRGPDRIYGRGLVAAELRAPPPGRR